MLDLVMFNLLLAQIIDAYMIIRATLQQEKDTGEHVEETRMRKMTILQKIHGLDNDIVRCSMSDQCLSDDDDVRSSSTYSLIDRFYTMVLGEDVRSEDSVGEDDCDSNSDR